MRAPFIATGVAALALAAWLLSPHGERGRKGLAAAPTAQHDGTDEQIAVMRHDIASLKRELVARRSDASPPAATADAPEAANGRGRTSDSPARPPRRSMEEIAHGLDQHLGHEGKDPAWSAKAETAIAAAFHEDALKGSSMLRADCHTTVCRVEVSHDDAAAQRDFLGSVRLVPPFNQEGFARRVDDPATGTSKTVVYVAREGYALPQLDDG